MLFLFLFARLVGAAEPAPLEMLNVYDRCFAQIAKPFKFDGVEHGALLDGLDEEEILGSGNNQLIVSGRKGTVIYSLEGNVQVKGVRCESSSEKKLGGVVAGKFDRLLKSVEGEAGADKAAQRRYRLRVERQLMTALEKCSQAFPEVAAIRESVTKRFRSAGRAESAESGR